MVSQKSIWFILFFFILSLKCFSTHIKGGEITFRRISSVDLTYEFTLTTYTENNAANRDQTEVNFCFGDGSGIFKVKRLSIVGLTNNAVKNIYKYTHTYPYSAYSYKVSVAIPNRNEGIRNIRHSVDVPFYVETIFSINPNLDKNSSPILLNQAADLIASVGKPFLHNANAVDAEGDSLAYRLTVSRTGNYETCNTDSRGIITPDFKQPNEVSTISSSFTINSNNGDLIWDSPQELGLYACAFIVEEWRNGVKISETVRDMQIEVKDLENGAPKIVVPKDICFPAGTLIRENITASDMVSKLGRLDPLTIVSSGNVYSVDSSFAIKQPFANFISQPLQSGIATGIFSWQTDCQHIRKNPYDIFFKVNDNPPYNVDGGIKLSDSKIWKIRIVAPKISGIKSIINTEKSFVFLNWSSYSCNLPNSKIIIYRKQAEKTNEISSALCQLGMSLTGFKEIARLSATSTTFEDRNDGIGLKYNLNYIYVLVVSYTNIDGIEDFSLMSELINVKNIKEIDCSKSAQPKLNSSKFTFCATDTLKLTIENSTKGDTYKWIFGNIIDSSNLTSKIFTQTGKLLIQKLDSLGCETRTDTINITKLESIPIPSLSSSNSPNLCLGQSVLLSSTGTDIQWYLNDIPIQNVSTNTYVVNKPGIYKVKSTKGNCNSAFSTPISVVLISPPSIPIISLGANNILISSSLEGNQWYFNDSKIENAIKNTFTPIANGQYKVEVTNQCGYSISLAYNIIITSIDEELIDQIIVSPNPFNSGLKINFSADFGQSIQAKVYDLLGNIRYLKNAVKGGEILDLSILNSGNYILEIVSDIPMKTQRMKISKY
ncbi:MAG: T9SS type A sorting domain-containing protein [Aquirufa sp.]